MHDPMIVQGFRTHHLSIPLERPVTNGTFGFRGIEHVLLELDVGDMVGIGHAFAFETHQAESIRAMVVDLVETLIGRPVDAVRDVWTELWHRINYIGHAGPPVMALSVVDTALWDLLAKRAGLPLFRLLGSARDSLPLYATGGWLSASKEELAEEAQRLHAQGFSRYKMKVGNGDWRVDVERVAHVADVLGDKVQLMVDANQGWSVSEAIAAGRELGDLGVIWLEEPVVVQDVEGSARVAAAVDVPVATGESVFTRYGFIPLIERRAADVLMLDLMRCGGPSEFLHIAGLAHDRQIPVSSHSFAEVSAHVMSGLPNAGLVEHIPGFTDVIFDGLAAPVDGMKQLLDRPGLGLDFSARAIRDHSVDDPVRTSVLVPGRDLPANVDTTPLDTEEWS